MGRATGSVSAIVRERRRRRARRLSLAGGLAAALAAAAELSAVEHPSLLTVLLWSGVGAALLTVALAGHLLDRRGGAEEAGERAAPVRGFVDGGTVDGRVSGVIAEAVPPGGIDGVVNVGDVGAGGDVAGVRLGRETGPDARG
ncbi:hypothetical protein ACIBSW_24495 [Actinoplanes sp. NPDC049668]|uniref:hypothetical protein n=1 Tax=unclassified Actinoplanes TaxID=2626549 RepID=UPI0033A2DFFD